MIKVLTTNTAPDEIEGAEDFDVTAAGVLFVHAPERTVAAYAPGQWAAVHIVDAPTEEPARG